MLQTFGVQISRHDASYGFSG
uniref:Uncharacterized protein n=1 Tax=Arundo donax TaxID=35708 RepID=A0A0A9GDV4_ARUDO